MSTQLDWIRKGNVKAAFTGKRGNPWWYLANQGMDEHLYSGAMPSDVVEKFFAFEVVGMPLYVEHNGGLITVPNRQAMVRQDTGDVYGVHSGKYRGHNYSEWLVEKVQTAVGGGADVANIGLLNKGAVAFVQIETPENYVADGNVTIRPFIIATTSFDGSIATTYKTGFTNVVCDNTYAAMMAESGDVYRVKHTRNSAFNVVDAATALNTLHMIAEQTTKEISRLLSVDVSDKAWQTFVEMHTPVIDEKGESLVGKSVTIAENKRQAITGLYRTDVRVAPWAGTAWGVVQAVNTYNQHLSTVRGVDHREERRMMRAVKGEIGPADRATLVTLGNVIGRELVTV